MWVYVKQLLSCLEGVQLPSVSISKIVPSSSFDREKKVCFPSMIAIAEEGKNEECGASVENE